MMQDEIQRIDENAERLNTKQEIRAALDRMEAANVEPECNCGIRQGDFQNCIHCSLHYFNSAWNREYRLAKMSIETNAVRWLEFLLKECV